MEFQQPTNHNLVLIPLSAAQQRIRRRRMAILRYIADHLARAGYSPSLGEIARASGTANSSACMDVCWLEEAGYLTSRPGKQRSTGLTAAGRERLEREKNQ